MSDEPKLTVHKVPVLDTGIGREAGYRDDAELIAAAEAERAKLPPAVRVAVEEIEREMQRRFIGE